MVIEILSLPARDLARLVWAILWRMWVCSLLGMVLAAGAGGVVGFLLQVCDFEEEVIVALCGALGLMIGLVFMLAGMAWCASMRVKGRRLVMVEA